MHAHVVAIFTTTGSCPIGRLDEISSSSNVASRWAWPARYSVCSPNTANNPPVMTFSSFSSADQNHSRLTNAFYLADVIANPAITSAAILVALALVLSPYVLVIGGIFLVFSAVSLPGPLKRILPAPVVEVRTV